MLGFILGISITINIVLVIAIIIYLNVKNKSFSYLGSSIVKDLEEDEIVDKKEADDFFKDDKLDFSNLLRK